MSPVWRSALAVTRLEGPQTQLETVFAILHPFETFMITLSPTFLFFGFIFVEDKYK